MRLLDNLFSRFYHAQLIAILEFMKVQQQMTRKRLGKRIYLDPEEKKLLIELAKPLGKNIREYINIVEPETFQKWIREENKPPKPKRPRGRPRIDPFVRDLILRLARENFIGHKQLFRKLKRFDVQVSKTAVSNILKAAKILPIPYRPSPWFLKLKRSCDTLLSCDFFTQPVWTFTGVKIFYVLFFFNVHTRKVQIAGITRHPTNAWIQEQLQKIPFDFQKSSRKLLIRDNDSKFTHDFDDFFKNLGFGILKTAFRSPDMNAYAESWIARIKMECLNHLIIFDELHLSHLIHIFVRYYNEERNSQEDLRGWKKNLKAEPILGGLFHRYSV